MCVYVCVLLLSKESGGVGTRNSSRNGSGYTYLYLPVKIPERDVITAVWLLKINNRLL